MGIIGERSEAPDFLYVHKLKNPFNLNPTVGCNKLRYLYLWDHLSLEDKLALHVLSLSVFSLGALIGSKIGH